VLVVFSWMFGGVMADISVAFVGGIDAGCYACNIFGELLRALGIYLHVFDHG
jgi:hypothetical protein